MARFQVSNKSYIRQDDRKYFDAFEDIERAINNYADQGNLDPAGARQAAPPQIGAINVVESGGIHDIKITDNSPAYAGLRYAVEYSQTADFQNFHTIDLGISQNHRANLGGGKYFWRAYSYYHAANRSTPTYHGGTVPVAVGSGDYPGPAMQLRQGFTGLYRNSTVPPIRK